MSNSTPGHILSIHVPLNRLHLVDNVNAVSDAIPNISRSTVVIDCIEYMLGRDYYELESRIINLYEEERLPLPKANTSFEFGALLQAELKNTDLQELPGRWGITRKELAFVLYGYTLRTCP